MTTAEVIELLTANGVPCGAVNDLEDVPTSMDAVAPGALVRETHPQLGEMVHPAPVVEFDEPVAIRPSPAFGEHTDEVRRRARRRPRLRPPAARVAQAESRSAVSAVSSVPR